MKIKTLFVVGTPIVATIVILIGTSWMKTREDIVRAQTQIETLQASAQAAPSLQAVQPNQEQGIDPHQFSELIKVAQRANVKESWGEQAHQAFTSDDLEKFKTSKRAEAIAEELASSAEFVGIAAALKKIDTAERRRILDDANRPLHPTWAELGRISRDGQTEAGQAAELMIADAIVLKMEGLLKRSDDQLKGEYSRL